MVRKAISITLKDTKNAVLHPQISMSLQLYAISTDNG